MNSPSQSADHERWERLVGKAILRFGDIELISIKCLSLVPSDKVEKSASRLEFGRRAGLLLEILEARKDIDEHLAAIRDGMKRAVGLAATRNIIAHNPVMLDLYVNEDETEMHAQHSITSARSGGQTLTLEALEEFAEDVDGLSSELWHAFLNFTGTSEHLWRSSK